MMGFSLFILPGARKLSLLKTRVYKSRWNEWRPVVIPNEVISTLTRERSKEKGQKQLRDRERVGGGILSDANSTCI